MESASGLRKSGRPQEPALSLIMADAAKVEQLLKDETVQAVAALEPIALDPKKLVEESLAEAGNDLDTARQKIAEKAADTARKE